MGDHGEVGQSTGCRSRAACCRSVACHSAMARKESTATTATPAAAMTAPTRPIEPARAGQPSAHWRSVTACPIRPPETPATRMARRARARARVEGSAEERPAAVDLLPGGTLPAPSRCLSDWVNG